jgi:hypothetical protein
MYLLTLTPPGDRQHYYANGRPCPCTPPGGVDLAEWNRNAARCWNRWLTAFERLTGVRPSYFRGVEIQDGKRRIDGIGRGGIHYHVVLRVPVKISLAQVRKLAKDAGFGHQVKLDTIDPKSREWARYVSKYVTKTCDDRDVVPWNVLDVETGELTSGKATFRAYSQAKSWGISMRDIRAAAQVKSAELAALRGVYREWESPLVIGETAITESPPAPS